MYDVTILTEPRYIDATPNSEYLENVLLEDQLLKDALEKNGLTVTRKSWDDSTFDWSKTAYVIFRSTWDYFERFPEFKSWLDSASQKTKFINSKEIVYWNMDKHYLNDLAKNNINIPPTIFIEQGNQDNLEAHTSQLNWGEFILKPAIAGTARHTYRFKPSQVNNHQAIFAQLIANESMLLQEYQKQITTKGEISLVMFGGKFSHAVHKKAKKGDFRVQDDFGGTVDDYHPSSEEIAFAEKALVACKPFAPIYARVDIFWDNEDQLCLAELEMIEPELWFRKNGKAASLLSKEILKVIRNK